MDRGEKRTDVTAAATAEHRGIPLEVLRDFAISQSETTSMRQVAEEAGVGRTTLLNFVSRGTKPHPRIRRRLALWFLMKRDRATDNDVVRPYATAINLLLADMPAEQRQRAEEKVLAALVACFDLGPITRPQWLVLLSERSEARSLKTA